MQIELNKLKELLSNGVKIEGTKPSIFTGIQSIYEVENGEITWIKEGVKGEKDIINETKASGIICAPSTYAMFNGNKEDKVFFVTNEPKGTFVKVIQEISNSKSKKNDGHIHPTAIIHPDAEIGEGVSIGAYTVIGSCKIGKGTTIYDHVKVYDEVTIGSHCVIREFCSIGGAGFGFAPNEEGINTHIPHIGYTIIEDYVQIFPFCNVDRGNLGKTMVGKGTVMDHHVHVSHNCIVGENNIITAGVKFAGGAEVRNNSFIGVSTAIKEKAIIGSNCITGIGSVIIKDIPDNEIWVGNPAKYLKTNK